MQKSVCVAHVAHYMLHYVQTEFNPIKGCVHSETQAPSYIYKAVLIQEIQ